MAFYSLNSVSGCIRPLQKLKVRIIEDNPEIDEGGLEFEVENQSKTETSLSPNVKASFLTCKGKSMVMNFDVRELDRHLPPFEPKLFSASARSLQTERFNGWFRVYKFQPTKGKAIRVRIRNAGLEEIGVVLFFMQKTWFKLFGHVNVKGSTSNDEYRASKRARGPH